MRIGAYLHAQIDTNTRKVRMVLISSDQRPTMTYPHLIWAHITTTYGDDFAMARKEMIKHIKAMPYLHWVKPLLPNTRIRNMRK